MYVKITPTDLTRTTFPDEVFDFIDIGGTKVPLSQPVTITDAQHATVFAATFAHPENGLPCKYFIVETISESSPESALLANAVVDEVKLYAAIYANLLSTLDKAISPTDAAHAASTIYIKFKDTYGKETVSTDNDA